MRKSLWYRYTTEGTLSDFTDILFCICVPCCAITVQDFIFHHLWYKKERKQGYYGSEEHFLQIKKADEIALHLQYIFNAFIF